MAEFEVRCGRCDSVLDDRFHIIGKGIVLGVEPCEKCWEEAHDEGWEDNKEGR